MSFFNHEHGYAFSDEDQVVLNALAQWNGKLPLPTLRDHEVEHLIKELYKAMDTMNTQRTSTLSKEVEGASLILWRFYRDEHQKATLWIDLNRRSMRQAA